MLLTNSQTSANIQVRDNGAGIPPESEPQIFDAYYRVPSQSQHAASIGLGLAVSRDLARLMGGDLTYNRHQNETIFELQLPLATPTNRPPPDNT